MESLILEPEFYVDFDGVPHSGSITISDSRVVGLGNNESIGRVIKLKNQVVMPGFVNAHSHVFQRLLRGAVEQRSNDQTQDDFWTWRQKMYACAQHISADVLRLVAELAYLEMLEAGFTHVGEFHYLHHEGDKDPLSMSRAIARAANKTRINLVLLECAYNRNNFSQPIAKEQARFAFGTVANFLDFVAKTSRELTSPMLRIGTAIHSVRAVPQEWFHPINEFVLAHSMPLHIHASEQVQENEACLRALGCSPIELLAKNHLLAPHTTLIHAIHLMDGDMGLLSKHKPHI